MLTRTSCLVIFVGLAVGLLGLLTACNGKKGYEAYCHASGGGGEGASKVYLCYQARSTCEKLQSKKAKIAEGHKDLHVGLCEKTTTMYCATPTTAGEQLVCGPSQASCDEVVVAAKASGRIASDCKEMSRADLDDLRKAEDERRKSAP